MILEEKQQRFLLLKCLSFVKALSTQCNKSASKFRPNNWRYTIDIDTSFDTDTSLQKRQHFYIHLILLYLQASAVFFLVFCSRCIDANFTRLISITYQLT